MNITSSSARRQNDSESFMSDNFANCKVINTSAGCGQANWVVVVERYRDPNIHLRRVCPCLPDDGR